MGTLQARTNAPKVGQIDLGHADERPAHLLPQLVLSALALLPSRDNLGRIAFW